MSGKVAEYLNGISEEKFNEILKDNKKVLVDCFAEWCGPCQQMKPVFKELAESDSYKDVEFVTIDTDNCEWINGKFDIDSIPRFLFFEDGKLTYEQKGASNKEAFEFTIKDKLLHTEFEHFHDQSGVSEEEFKKIAQENDYVIHYIYQEESPLNAMFKPGMVMSSEKYPNIYFTGISLDKTPWLSNHFGIKKEDYTRYDDKDKKVPYFLFYKDHKLMKETGVIPPEEIESIIKGDLLGLVKVEEFEKGIAKEKFDEIITGNKMVIVDIFTTWCGPCKMMKPIFQELSTEYENIKFISIDLDESRWLGSHPDYGTDAIPTFLFFKDGKMVKKNVGGMYKQDFVKMIKSKLIKQ